MDGDDLTFLNPMASKMLPKDDVGIQTVRRLQKELGELAARLPNRHDAKTLGLGNHLQRVMSK